MIQLKLTITFTFFSLFCSAQITTREIVIKEVEKPIIFDSTYFWYNSFDLTEELKKYIGQEIYILPISKIDTNRQYFDFYFQPYDNWSYQFKVEYDSFVNQYLTILDADIRRTGGMKPINKWYLKLLYRNKDTIYYVPRYQIYEYRSIQRLPFMLTAFYNRSKNQFLSNEFIVKKDIEAKDINTGNKVLIKKDESWKCVDVTLVDLKKNDYKFFAPVLIFKNSNNNEIVVNFVKYIDYEIEIGDELVREFSYVYYLGKAGVEIDYFYTSEEYKLTLLQKQEKDRREALKEAKIEERKLIMKKKYGEYYGNLINNEKVAIGMTKEMCENSWGKPLLIDELIIENGKYVIWQYDYKTFLYFENNILKIIKQ